MSTLSSPRVREVLDKLFADAEESVGTFRWDRASLRAQGFELGSPEFDAAVREAHLAIDGETGKLLYLVNDGMPTRSTRSCPNCWTSTHSPPIWRSKS